MKLLNKLWNWVIKDIDKPWWGSCSDYPKHCSHGGRWYHEEYGRL